jgi:hypothetical protein
LSDYGRNFEFRKTPHGSARDGRFETNIASPVIPIGAPIVSDLVAGIDSTLGLQIVKLAPPGSLQDEGVAAAGGSAGLALYEYGPAAFAGDDPYLTTYSDKDVVPAGRAVQLIHGDMATKVCFTNTFARTFLGVRPYKGRIMVNGLGATPTVIVGDFLIPGLGDDVNGYWESTATRAGAWMEITLVDAVRNQVEARLLF